MDLIRDYALPLPTTIIAEMLGVNPRDRHKFHRWSSAILSSTSSKWGMLKAIPRVAGFMRYIRKLVRLRRAKPRDDLVTMLVLAEESGDQLSEDELLAMVFLLLFAGHETTVNLIGNATLALLEHPGEMEKLRRDPALMKSGGITRHRDGTLRERRPGGCRCHDSGRRAGFCGTRFRQS
jgi:cytochrome P450